MLINVSQFSHNLDINQNLYILFGAEELLVQQTKDKLLSALNKSGFQDRFIFDIDAKFNFITLKDELVAGDLFSSKKIIQLNISSLILKTTKELVVIANDIKEDVVVIMLLPKLTPVQQKSKWFGELKNNSLAIQHFEIYPEKMQTWVISQMQLIGLQENLEIAKIIADNNKGNLLNANNELQKLKFVYDNQKINIDEFVKQSKQQSIYTVYSLIDNALSGNVDDIYKTYNLLSIDANYLTSLLYFQIKQLIDISLKIKQKVAFDTAAKESGVWFNKIHIINYALKRHSYPILQKMLLKLGRIDRSIKGIDNKNIGQELFDLLLNLAGVKNGLN